MALKEISEKISILEQKIKEKKEREREEEIKRRKALLEEKRRFIKERKELSEKIFEWSRKFSQTKEFEKLVKMIGILNSLWIYGSGWGHVGGGNGWGCHSRIYVTGNGNIIYEAYYKWMGRVKRLIFHDDEEMAQNLRKDYLEKLWKFIESGEVYRRIEKEVNEKIKSMF